MDGDAVITGVDLSWGEELDQYYNDIMYIYEGGKKLILEVQVRGEETDDFDIPIKSNT